MRLLSPIFSVLSRLWSTGSNGAPIQPVETEERRSKSRALLAFLHGPLDGWVNVAHLDDSVLPQTLLRVPISESIFHTVAGLEPIRCSTLVTSVAVYRLRISTGHYTSGSIPIWEYSFLGSERLDTSPPGMNDGSSNSEP